jgi:hypothetical protein
VADLLHVSARRPVGVRDIPFVLFNPGKVFSRVEDVSAYAWPLALLLTLVTMIGWAQVQTGLIDREVERAGQERKAEVDRTQRDVVERSELAELYEDIDKEVSFLKLMTRVQVIAAAPAKMLATVLIISAILYGCVALTGRKPEWNTLLTINVLASFATLLGMIVRLVFMLRFETLEVDTSLAPLIELLPKDAVDAQAAGALAGLATAFDPFRLWYWLLVFTGLRKTMQLPGWRALLACSLMWLVAAGLRASLQASMMAAQAAQAASNGGS